MRLLGNPWRGIPKAYCLSVVILALPALWRCRGHGTPEAQCVGQGAAPRRVEALPLGPYGEGGELEVLRKRWHALPLVRQTDDACAFDPPSGYRT
jgi:hypothetical protein